MAEVYSPAPAEIRSVWPKVKPLVEHGLLESGHDEYTVEDVHSALLNGHLQLWMGKGETTPGIGLTQIASYPQFRTVIVMFCVGNHIDEWEEAGLDAIETWARKSNMRAVEIIGRNGWTRRLGRRGYRRDAVTLRKEL